jgi:hypothetical protein
MTDVINAINFIRSHGRYHKHDVFLDEIKSEYGNTVYYSEVCWLSKGKVLQHFQSVLEEIKVFLMGFKVLILVTMKSPVLPRCSNVLCGPFGGMY